MALVPGKLSSLFLDCGQQSVVPCQEQGSADGLGSFPIILLSLNLQHLGKQHLKH